LRVIGQHGELITIVLRTSTGRRAVIKSSTHRWWSRLWPSRRAARP
jgi:hypothetical protein